MCCLFLSVTEGFIFLWMYTYKTYILQLTWLSFVFPLRKYFLVLFCRKKNLDNFVFEKEATVVFETLGKLLVDYKMHLTALQIKGSLDSTSRANMCYFLQSILSCMLSISLVTICFHPDIFFDFVERRIFTRRDIILLK